MNYPKLIENLIEQFSRFPGVGRRSAERMVFYLLNHPKEEAQRLSELILSLKEKLQFCRICNNLTDTEKCDICLDPLRNHKLICIVENPKDLLAIERTGVYKGAYHVLLGTISPVEGRGPDELRVQNLIHRIHSDHVEEIVIATDPDSEGEMTSLYLIKQLKPLPVKVSRIGFGLPVGSAVEYADMSTLSMSLNARRIVE